MAEGVSNDLKSPHKGPITIIALQHSCGVRSRKRVGQVQVAWLMAEATPALADRISTSAWTFRAPLSPVRPFSQEIAKGRIVCGVPLRPPYRHVQSGFEPSGHEPTFSLNSGAHDSYAASMANALSTPALGACWTVVWPVCPLCVGPFLSARPVQHTGPKQSASAKNEGCGAGMTLGSVGSHQ